VTEAPTTGVVATGSYQGADYIAQNSSLKQITTLPCICASGHKLKLACIIAGKTTKTLEKITREAPAWVNKSELYFSEKGWSTQKTMLEWLYGVVLPYTKLQPSALLLDAYGCHWTADFVAHAGLLNIELIAVPPGTTPTMQPLDVGFNGPMSRARTAIWQRAVITNPFFKDNYQMAVARAAEAYDNMTQHAARAAFAAAYLVD
jgi:hypothetical protein